MTIDQLLTDVTPLLPFGETTDGYPTVNYMPVRSMSEDQQSMFKDYLMHAANHFPAMLAALREIAKQLDRQKHSTPLTNRLAVIVADALAAAEVVE
jgi:hypothetical protein